MGPEAAVCQQVRGVQFSQHTDASSLHRAGLAASCARWAGRGMGLLKALGTGWALFERP